MTRSPNTAALPLGGPMNSRTENPLRLGKGATYIALVEDLLVTSNADGTSRMTIITDKDLWGMGLNLSSLLGCLRVSSLSNNAGVLLGLQYSFDGNAWLDASTVVVAEQTAVGSDTGSFSTVEELTPFIRIVARVREVTSPTTEVTARISAWLYLKFRT